MTGKTLDLAEFAKTRKRATSIAWFDKLPEDVKQQCIEGWRQGLRATVICDWLVSVGHEDATPGKVAAIEARTK